MKKCYIFNLVLLTAFAQSAWAMKKDNNLNQIIENNNNISIPESNFVLNDIGESAKPESNSVLNDIGESAKIAANNFWRKCQKSTGFLSVAAETNEERQNRINNFSLLNGLQDLSEDAKKGGLISTVPSLFKQLNDRVHENNIQAQNTLVYMYDKKSLDVNQLKLGKEYIENSKAYSQALYSLLDTCYKEKFAEITKSIDEKKDDK